MSSTHKKDRDIDQFYSLPQFIEKLRRLADCLENGEKFNIQVDGERLYVPKNAIFSIEHERTDGHEEIEFQIKWTRT